jgi:hypothetical protein
MSPVIKYLIVAVVAFAGGIAFSKLTAERRLAPPQVETSPFESDAVGFITWFHVNKVDGISPKVLEDNVRILETKALAAGRLPSKSTKGD